LLADVADQAADRGTHRGLGRAAPGGQDQLQAGQSLPVVVELCGRGQAQEFCADGRIVVKNTPGAWQVTMWAPWAWAPRRFMPKPLRGAESVFVLAGDTQTGEHGAGVAGGQGEVNAGLAIELAAVLGLERTPRLGVE
jgi:hypothetical protein